MTTPFIQELHIYPIKSCHGVSVPAAYAGPRGLSMVGVGDRRWMLVNENGRFISQRQERSLARVKIELLRNHYGLTDGLRVSSDGYEPLILRPTDITEDRRDVVIHGKKTVVHNAWPSDSRWFARFLKKDGISLVYQTDEDSRLCDPNFVYELGEDEDDLADNLPFLLSNTAHRPGEYGVSLADGFPFLVTNGATLEKLNELATTPVPMSRFRPNIVIGGVSADAEYNWEEIRIGPAARIRLVKPCTRCEMPAVDQESGVMTDADPREVLRQHYFLNEAVGRGNVRGLIFGENAVPLVCRDIHVGDKVEVISTKAVPYNFKRLGAPGLGE